MVVIRNVLMDDDTAEQLHIAAEDAGISDTLMCRRVLQYWGAVFKETRRLYELASDDEKMLMRQDGYLPTVERVEDDGEDRHN